MVNYLKFIKPQQGVEKNAMEMIKFVINEAPFAYWDWELKKKNLEFLEGIEPDYFAYVVKTHAEHLEGEDKHKAALSLRLAYSHGLETLFALLCSAVQAPQCSIGWILNYRNADLLEVVNKISAYKPVYTKIKEKPVTWELLAKLVHANVNYEADKKLWIQKGFGELWRNFASDFANDNFILEYNSIKHGLRAKPGGFHLAFGLEKTYGVPAPPEKMTSLGGSAFGSSYFVREQIIPTDKINFRPRRHGHNWSPYNLAHGLFLISTSINNVISWLRIINGVPADKCRFENPESKEAFEQPWKEHFGVTHINMDTIIEKGQIEPFSQEDILKTYEET